MALFLLILVYAYRWREALTYPPPTYSGKPRPSTHDRIRDKDRSPKVAVWTCMGD